MNNPNDPYSAPPHGAPPQPPYGGPPQPPYPAQLKSNSKLLIGIIAGLVLVILVGAILYFTGALGGGSKGARPGGAAAAGPPVPVTRENIVGVWSQEEDCSFVVDYKANGDYYNTGTDTGWSAGQPRAGRWRLEGNRLYFTKDAANGAEGYADLQNLTANTHTAAIVEVAGSSPVKTFERIRCDFPPAPGGASATPSPAPAAPPVGPAPAPSAPSAPASDIEQRLQQSAGRMSLALPQRIGPITVTSVRASGRVMTVEATVPEPLNDASWASLDSNIRRGMCGSTVGDLVRAGGTVRVNVTDAANGRWSAPVSRC